MWSNEVLPWNQWYHVVSGKVCLDILRWWDLTCLICFLITNIKKLLKSSMAYPYSYLIWTHLFYCWQVVLSFYQDRPVTVVSGAVELPCGYTGSPWIDTKSSAPCLSSLLEFLNNLIHKTAVSPWKHTGGADCFVLTGLRKVWAKTWLRNAGRY